MEIRTVSAPWRPPLLPRSGWGRTALLFLVLFTLLRSVLWASVQPAWLAPDEDYHWLYVNYLVEKGTVPQLNGPFYNQEIFKEVSVLQQGAYLAGPRTTYSGGPHAMLDQLGGPSTSRTPAPPPPRPVLHPPAYYLPDVVIDNVLWSKDGLTRLTAMRYYSAALGALTVFFAWLLAAQVLAREWQQLGAAALVSLQPILAFSASTMTNDVGVAVTLTATLAWCAWMLRGPPASRQGIGLGVLFAIAIMVKATMLSLVIVIAVTMAMLYRTYPDARGELKRMLVWVVGIPAVLAGWWYVRLLIVTHSILGERGSLTASHGAHGPGLLHAPSVAWQWISAVYRGYWFDYLVYEVRTQDLWFWLPVIGMVIAAAGFVLMIRDVRTQLRPRGAEMRIVLLLVLTALVLVIPPLALDVLRGTEGLPFTTVQGRFLTPAYPGLAVVAVLALRRLTGWSRWAFPALTGVVVAVAFAFYCHTWIVYVLERFYGPVQGHWLRALFHASFDKPAFITQNSLAGIALAALACFLVAAVVTVVGSLRADSTSALVGLD